MKIGGTTGRIGPAVIEDGNAREAKSALKAAAKGASVGDSEPVNNGVDNASTLRVTAGADKGRTESMADLSDRVEAQDGPVKSGSERNVIDITAASGPREGVSGQGTLPNDINQLAREVTAQLSSLHTDLKIEVDDASGNFVFKVLDPETSDVLRQIPSEEMLRISRRLTALVEDYSNRETKTVAVFEDTGSKNG